AVVADPQRGIIRRLRVGARHVTDLGQRPHGVRVFCPQLGHELVEQVRLCGIWRGLRGLLDQLLRLLILLLLQAVLLAQLAGQLAVLTAGNLAVVRIGGGRSEDGGSHGYPRHGVSPSAIGGSTSLGSTMSASAVSRSCASHTTVVDQITSVSATATRFVPGGETTTSGPVSSTMP